MSSACGMLPGSQPGPTPVPSPAAAAAASAVPIKPAGSASPSASPIAKPIAASTTAAAAVDNVWVGNTDGEGVYVRKTPVMADRIKAYPDKTQLTIIGVDVDGDGQKWHHVRAPDGVEGYVPVQYTVTTEP